VIRTPFVTCLVTAYNYERYVARAIESALAQDYPSEAFEIVVIDDGSTDGTAEAIRPYLDRVRYFRQENGGLLAATNRGIAEARGELIGFLDADDMWLPDKVSRQAEVFVSRPEVGLVSGEMEIVDDWDQTVSPRYFAGLGIKPPSGRVLGTYMRQNLSPAPTIMFRAALKHAFYPIPPVAPNQDWWATARIAEIAEVVSLPDPLTRYRSHSGQMSSFGAMDEKWVKTVQDDNHFRRWMFRHLDLARVTMRELAIAWNAFDQHVAVVSQRWAVPATDLIPVSDDDRLSARANAAEAERLAAAGDLPAAVRTQLVAMADDPFDADLRRAYDAYANAVLLDPASDPILEDARGFVTVARATELAADPALLAAYAAVFGPADDATLVVHVPDSPALDGLMSAIEAAGVAESEMPDLLALQLPAGPRAESLLARTANAVLGASQAGNAPRYGAAAVPELRSVAERIWHRSAAAGNRAEAQAPGHLSDTRQVIPDPRDPLALES
jgi:glycosyltransferase involved in cell wall biosynthesis